MQDFHLAQINIAWAEHALDAPEMQDFVSALDAINALAEQQPGFVWRFQGSYSTEESPWPEDILPNLSVWESVEALLDYVYRTDHVAYLKRKGEWFKKMNGPHLALWWIPAGHTPTLSEAKTKLEHLATHGPSPEAFTLAQRFPEPGVAPCA